MHRNRPTWTWLIDGCIAILFLTLLWQLYAPLAKPHIHTVESIETESIAVEHIIRDLHAHAETLPGEERKALLAGLVESEEERDRLLEMMETAQELDDTLSQMVIQIWSTLVPKRRCAFAQNGVGSASTKMSGRSGNRPKKT